MVNEITNAKPIQLLPREEKIERKEQHPQNIVLLNMPFSGAHYPSLALSTLKAETEKRGHTVTIHNYNLLFAQMIGRDFYEDLARGDNAMLCEQIFAQILFPERENDEQFVEFVGSVIPYKNFRKLVSYAEQFLQLCLAELSFTKADLFGFSTTFHQKMASIALTKKIRASRIATPVVFGGAACEQPMGSALMREYPQIDYVFYGEADSNFPEFVDVLAHGEQKFTHLAGLCFRDVNGMVRESTGAGKPVVMDRLSLPAYDDFIRDVAEYDMGEDYEYLLSYESSRGCWWGQKHHCTFCGLNGTQMKFRCKSAETVMSQLNSLLAVNDACMVQFSDNILKHQFLHELVPQLGQFGDLRYFFEIKANLKEHHIETFAKNRVTKIQPGIERLSDHVLKIMRKGSTARQNVQLLRWCADHRIEVSWNILYGFSGESAEDIYKEISLYEQLFHLEPPVGCSFLRLDRFSPNFNNSREHGFVVEGPSKAERFLHYRAKEVDELAYHFEYDYLHAEDHTPELRDAWRKLDKTVERWLDQYKKGAVVGEDDGERIIIRDTRESGNPLQITIRGEMASLYRYLNTARTQVSVEQKFPLQIDNLAALVRQKLVIAHGDWLMASAVKTERHPVQTSGQTAQHATVV